MRSKAMIPLALGLVLGLVALKLGVDAVKKAQGGQTTSPEIEVVVATVDIGPTIQLKSDMMVVRKTMQTPLLPADAFSKIEDVVDRVTSKSIPAGTPISPGLLAVEGTLPGLEVKIPEGYRAVSVKIDEVSGVAYQLLPGSFVDVLVVMDVKVGASRKKQTMSRIILQNIQVAAVGQLLGGPKESKGGKASRVQSVTLLVAVEEVPKLHLAQTKGKITLAMRGSEDELLTAGLNALEDELLGQPPEKKADPEPDAGSTSLFNAIAPTMFAQAPQNPPWTCTVINGPLSADSSGQVIRVTYANSDSMEVVEVGKGRTTGDSTSMRFGTGERQEPSSRGLFGDRDRTLRRRGARSGGSDRNDEDDNKKETGE